MQDGTAATNCFSFCNCPKLRRLCAVCCCAGIWCVLIIASLLLVPPLLLTPTTKNSSTTIAWQPTCPSALWVGWRHNTTHSVHRRAVEGRLLDLHLRHQGKQCICRANGKGVIKLGVLLLLLPCQHAPRHRRRHDTISTHLAQLRLGNQHVCLHGGPAGATPGLYVNWSSKIQHKEAPKRGSSMDSKCV